MKIGWIVPGFSADETDWCIPALLNIARKLAEQHEIHVFTLRYPHFRRDYEVYGVKVHALGGATTAGLGRIPLLVRTIQAVAAHRPFDVLHGLWADEPGFVAVLCGYLLDTPAVVSLMGGELVNLPQINYGHQLSRSARWMVNYSLRHAEHITVGSQTLKTKALSHVDPSRLSITPLGVDTTLFSPGESDILDGDYKLLHVASLIPIKNQHLLLEAFAHIHNTLPGTKLHIVGEGILRPELEAWVAQHGLNAAVTFHGDVSHEQLPLYYRSAHVCLLTSYYESQSMVTLEAAACGKVTIGTPVGILPEFTDLLGDNAADLADEVRKFLQKMQHKTEIYRKITVDDTIMNWLQIYQMGLQ